MKYRRRLRSRLIVSFLVFGTLLRVLFAAAVLFLQSWLVDALISDTLEQEIDQYITHLREDPSLVEPFYSRIEGYVTRPGQAEREHVIGTGLKTASRRELLILRLLPCPDCDLRADAKSVDLLEHNVHFLVRGVDSAAEHLERTDAPRGAGSAHRWLRPGDGGSNRICQAALQ
jgi:hypothetical protein